MNTHIEFTIEQVEIAARFIAELVRQGIVFDVRTDLVGIGITLTGGF